jgi:nucleotide-binding universal stress UspA family protein
MNEHFSNILLPIDESSQSEIAQNMALAIAKLFNSKITLFHVISNELVTLPKRIYVPRENIAPISTATGQFPRTVIVPNTEEYMIPDAVVKEITEGLNEKAETLLSEAASSFSKEGITAMQKKTFSPNVADAILEEIETGQYDLVIIGNTGNVENPLDLHLGSVAAKISSNNSTSTLIVRRKAQLKTILVCVEDPIKDEKAIEKAYAVAKAAGTKVILLHVQEKSLLRLGPEVKKIGNQILSRAAGVFEGVEVEQLLIDGDPAFVILNRAEQADVDLVVLGRGGHRRLSHLLGSVGDHVVHYAKLSVLLAK